MSDTAADPVKVSVIIGFKDWGLERLELSIQSIHASLEGIPHEVIISDYGSSDSSAIADLAASVDAVHAIAATEGEWSRSRALNAGVRASSGGLILATYADMLFTRRALSRTVEQLEQHPHEIVILQCRDLPLGYSHDVVRREGVDENRFARIGQIRPRWGMGGLVGIRRNLWDRLRGWDERMHTYGGEDVDFGRRAQRMGARIDWLDEPGVAMFHIWHPSTSARAGRSPEATAAIAANRKIHQTDPTTARNRTSARYLPKGMLPLVTVILDGRGATEGDVKLTLAGIISQTVLDIEVLILGDEHVELARTLPEVNGRNVRCIPGTSDEGLSIEGTFCIAAVAGDQWVPGRLERLLDAMASGIGLSSDCAVEVLVDSEDGSISEPLAVPQSELIAASVLIDSRLLPHELITQGAAWGEIVREVAAYGTTWATIPTVGRLSRTASDSEERTATDRAAEVALLLRVLARCEVPQPAAQVDPARPVEISGFISSLGGTAMVLRATVPPHAADAVESIESLLGPPTAEFTVEDAEGSVLRRTVQFIAKDALSAACAIALSRDLGVRLEPVSDGAEPVVRAPEHVFTAITVDLEAAYGDGRGGTWVVSARSEAEELVHRDPTASTAVLNRTVVLDGTRHALCFTRFTGGSVASAGRATAGMPDPALLIEIALESKEVTA